jgi:preprotein translocase subunit Sec61beta
MDVDERRNIKIHPLVAILVPLALLALVIAVASLLGGR